MEKEKLYRLMDVLDEIKQIDELLSKHKSHTQRTSSLMIDQYKARKEQLLTYFINEINALAEYRSYSLTIIKQIMERFYHETEKESSKKIVKDKNLSALAEALSA
jgi:hypothetical protein